MNQAKLQSSQSETFAEAEGGHTALSHQLGRFCPHLHLHGIIDTVAWTSSVDAAQTLYSGKKWVQRSGFNIEPILFILFLQEHCLSHDIISGYFITCCCPSPSAQHFFSTWQIGFPRKHHPPAGCQSEIFQVGFFNNFKERDDKKEKQIPILQISNIELLFPLRLLNIIQKSNLTSACT